jgi:hypothetical protein
MTYDNLDDVIQAFNEERIVRPDDVAPELLGQPVWVGMVSSEGGYLPHAYAYSTKRSDVTAWLREMGARNLGRAGAACDYQRGLTYEVAEYLVTELL